MILLLVNLAIAVFAIVIVLGISLIAKKNKKPQAFKAYSGAAIVTILLLMIIFNQGQKNIIPILLFVVIIIGLVYKGMKNKM